MQTLPGNIVRLTRSSQGITLYFPPLRNPGAALMVALFGVSCFVPGFFASIAMAPFAAHGPGGMIAIWLMSIFILPFVGFGVLFVALAVYQVSNSLTVSVTPQEIRSRRRVFGLGIGERRVACADVAALDALTALRFRWPREATSHYKLVLRARGGSQMSVQPGGADRIGRLRARTMTVAESLRGEDLMEQVRAEIIRAARLDHLRNEGGK